MKGKEMFYLTMHSTHFILRLYDVRQLKGKERKNKRSKGRKEMLYLKLYLMLYGVTMW